MRLTQFPGEKCTNIGKAVNALKRKMHHISMGKLNEQSLCNKFSLSLRRISYFVKLERGDCLFQTTLSKLWPTLFNLRCSSQRSMPSILLKVDVDDFVRAPKVALFRGFRHIWAYFSTILNSAYPF